MMDTKTNKRIYLDHAATTCIDERVLEAMIPYLRDVFGNPSSLHATGTMARLVLEHARVEIAASIGARREEIIFTSGGTESNNLALKGIAWANRDKGNHLVVSAIEHDCILNACEWLEEQGFRVSRIPVNESGVVDPDLLADSIGPETILVSVMYANNEIGTIQPIRAIGEVCKQSGIPFHTDACQAYGKIPVEVDADLLSLMTINSHKIYGPKGVGALYVRNGTKIGPLLHGGGQEIGLRSSTQNVPGIAGFAYAASLCMEEMKRETLRLSQMKRKLVRTLRDQYDSVYFNGDPEHTLPGYLNFSFHGLEGETIRLLLLLDELGFAVSAGSACSSNHKNHSASHVLQAIGRNPLEARGAIRLSMGRSTTEADLEAFTEALRGTVGSLRSIFSSVS
jgi:cysteine desulfurase